MQITIFGASGKVGRLVVREALLRGYSVTAFIHSSAPFQSHDNLTIAHGDIHDKATVIQALRGSNAVISTLGSWGTPKKDILASAMQNIIPAMEATSVKRIISLTGSEARFDGDGLGLIHRLMYAVARIIAPKILHDAEMHMTMLRQSSLNWTVLRAPVMTNIGRDAYGLGTARPKPWNTITRHGVALALLDQLKDTEYFQRSPFISRL